MKVQRCLLTFTETMINIGMRKTGLIHITIFRANLRKDYSAFGSLKRSTIGMFVSSLQRQDKKPLRCIVTPWW